MDLWKYFDITHREHVLCNPTNVEKIDELITLLRLEPGAKVLEIATGKGEFIIRLVERYEIEGIEWTSPQKYFRCREKKKARIQMLFDLPGDGWG